MERMRDPVGNRKVKLSGLWLGMWRVLRSGLEDHSRAERLC